MLKDERIDKVKFTRRDALKIAGAAGVMAALPWSGIAEAEAAAPALKGPQAGGYYRFAIGEIEAIVISDGGLSFQPIQPTWAPEASKEELEGMLRSAFLPTDRLNLDVNTLLLKIGGELILVDSGAGGLFGPSLGKQRERLSAAGVAPAQVTGVVLTHAHGDHFGGLLDGDGKQAFPNAAYFASKTEIDYWTGADPDMSKLRLPEENKKVFAANAKRYFGSHQGSPDAGLAGTEDRAGAGSRGRPRPHPGAHRAARLLRQGDAAARGRHGPPPHTDVRPPRVDLRLRLGPEDGGGDASQDPRPGGGRRVAGPGVPPPVPRDRPRADRQGEAASSGCRSHGTGRREGILSGATGGESPAAGSPPADRCIALLRYGLIITILMLVISSQAKRTPSRPRPESLFPPYGMWSTRKIEVSLIMTPPTLIRSTAYIAFFRSLV